MSKNKILKIGAVAFVVITMSSLIIMSNIKSSNKEKEDESIILNPDLIKDQEEDIKKSILNDYDTIANYVFKYRLKHPHVVMAQFIIESNYFKSKIATENKNLCGMKFPGRRPTLATGVSRGHATFDSWEDCVIDYAIYQSSSKVHTITDDEYIDLLSKRGYAEDQTYSNKVKSLSNKIKNGELFNNMK